MYILHMQTVLPIIPIWDTMKSPERVIDQLRLSHSSPKSIFCMSEKKIVLSNNGFDN
ncbi:mCG62440, isoform CRA_b [Mus musculus]|nr:mCG62440, isoform CRA_b [Mus musculus]